VPEVGRILGLPAHPLLAHVPVVLLPLLSVAGVVCAVWPRARRRAGPVVVLLAVVGLVVVQLTIGSGETLEEDVPESELVEDHAGVADTLLPVAGGFTVAIGALVWLDRAAGSARWARTALPVLGVLTVALAAATGAQTFRAGHSGAEAVWDDPARPMLEP
jgi:uncharacterized membrane protein